MNDQMRDYRLKLKYDYGAWIEQILKGQVRWSNLERLYRHFHVQSHSWNL